MTVQTVQTVRHDPALVTACRSAAVVSAVAVLALLLFYAFELRSTDRHLFGPLSDVSTVVWDLLLVVVVGGTRPVLGSSRRAQVLVLATVATSAAGAVASALLTIDALGFEVATSFAVAAVLVQSLWLHRVSTQLRGTSWSAGVLRLGRVAPVAQGCGAVVVLAGLALPWASTAQLVVVIAGVAIGLPAWGAWPVWFFLAAREVGRSGVPLRGQESRMIPEEVSCPRSPASTTSP